jgi:hypothetical protein
VTSPREPRDAESTSSTLPDEHARLQREIDELKTVLGRAAFRIQKLETELETSRAQVARGSIAKSSVRSPSV